MAEAVKTVLIVDDEERMRRVIADYLTIKGYASLEAANGLEALSMVQAHPVDLVLLDVMMPQMDGFETCRLLRQRYGALPIIMLTARGEETDELQGFDLGADEYISKPFSLKILFARIEAVLRRNGETTPSPVAQVGILRVNTDSREVFVADRLVELTYTEFELLIFLMHNAGIALSRDKILDNVWRYDYYGDARTVDTHIKKLRFKLGAGGEYIKTIRGIGYKFETVG